MITFDTAALTRLRKEIAHTEEQQMNLVAEVRDPKRTRAVTDSERKRSRELGEKRDALSVALKEARAARADEVRAELRESPEHTALVAGAADAWAKQHSALINLVAFQRAAGITLYMTTVPVPQDVIVFAMWLNRIDFDPSALPGQSRQIVATAMGFWR